MAIRWEPPGFKESQGGFGFIDDADPALCGQFTATFEPGAYKDGIYESGRWKIDYIWC